MMQRAIFTVTLAETTDEEVAKLKEAIKKLIEKKREARLSVTVYEGE